MYIGVRSGTIPTVYTEWKEAEEQLLVCHLSFLSLKAELIDRITLNPSSRLFLPKWPLMRISKGGMELVDILYR